MTGQGFHLPMDQLAGEPFWVWLGGLCGVVFLTANVILLTKLGSAETVILPVLGQLLMGLLVDSLGLFRAQQIPLTPCGRLAQSWCWRGLWWWPGRGRLLPPRASAPPADCGCGASWGGRRDVQRHPDGHQRPPGPGGGLPPDGLHGVLPGGAGGAGGAVRRSPGQAGAAHPGAGKFPWWTWTGGLLGAVYVLANIYLSGILGTGMTVIILLVGATAGGAVIDHFGLLGAARKSLTVRKVVGILGMLAGAAAIKLF